MYEIAIIGAGPAGASAALFAARAKKKVLLIDDDRSATKKAWVGNHYGVLGIAGQDLYETGKIQARRAGAALTEASVREVIGTAGQFSVVTDRGSYAAACVIAASGLSLEWASAAGLGTRPGTEPQLKTVIATDAAGRTTVPGIWAAGLCAGVGMHTMLTAADGARVVIELLSEEFGKRYSDHDMV